MQIVGSFGRACAALVLLSAFGAGLATTAPAQASTPSLLWRNIARVNVLCLVQTDAGVDNGRLHDSLCRRVRDAAAIGAPAPVQIIATGDPAVLSPDSVTLLVHGSVQGASTGRQLVFSIRPYRNSGEPMLFTAAPRAVSLSGPAGRNSEFEAALGAVLSETLPWLNRPAGARPIR